MVSLIALVTAEDVFSEHSGIIDFKLSVTIKIKIVYFSPPKAKPITESTFPIERFFVAFLNLFNMKLEINVNIAVTIINIIGIKVLLTTGFIMFENSFAGSFPLISNLETSDIETLFVKNCGKLFIINATFSVKLYALILMTSFILETKTFDIKLSYIYVNIIGDKIEANTNDTAKHIKPIPDFIKPCLYPEYKKKIKSTINNISIIIHKNITSTIFYIVD